MLLLEFSMTPLDKGESVSEYVARSLDIIDKSGLDYKLGPMGTCVEGNFDEVFIVVKKCFEKMQQDCTRITCTIKFDYRKNRKGALQSKIKTVEEKVGRKLKS
ncbi:MAG: MTH1187 family thiamine-binding protein [Cyanobacteria bacterium]|nr:MTH1187 family thiamine-binding protein [Cyanobacteriota bacterium]